MDYFDLLKPPIFDYAVISQPSLSKYVHTKLQILKGTSSHKDNKVAKNRQVWLHTACALLKCFSDCNMKWL